MHKSKLATVDKRVICLYSGVMSEQPVPEIGLKDKTEAELFADLINQNWTDEEQHRLARAFELSRELHADDKHRDQPYNYHLLRVANRIVSYLAIHDAELVTAALLHDSVEDHPLEIIVKLAPGSAAPDSESERQQAALNALASTFSPRTTAIVAAVTNPPDLFVAESYEAGLENYRHKVRKAVQTTEGCLLKFSDWCDNAVGIIHSNFQPGNPREVHFQNKYGGELIEIFADRFAQPDLCSLLNPSAQAYVQQQLSLARQRLSPATQ